jgi:diacylglycerol kinase (ATP)
MSDQVFLVVNPAAGGDPLGIADAVAERCAARGIKVSVLPTEYPGHAEQLAAGLACGARDVVVPVGGDGTVRDVVSGLTRGYAGRLDQLPAVLVSPGGSGNSSYLGIWADRPFAEVLDLVFGDGAETRRLDLAVAAELDRVLLLGAGTGLIAQALVTARGLSGVARRERYQLALAETMRDFRPYPGRVTVDGEVLAEGPMLMVAVGGGQYRGGGFRLLPESLLDDGLLDVCVCGAANPVELAGLARSGQHLGHPAVRYGRGAEVVLERTDGGDLVFECDGDVAEPAGTVHTVRVLPGALPMLMPSIVD